MRVFRVALIIAFVVAGAFFCIYGGVGYAHLLSHQPPPHYAGGPLPPGTTSNPPGYAFFIAGWLSIFWFVGAFCGSLLVCWLISMFRQSSVH
jgi:hypothetical protein